MDNHLAGKKNDKDLVDLCLLVGSQRCLQQLLIQRPGERDSANLPSLDQYTTSFLAPLLEETREELRSSLELLSHAPVCEILSAKRCMKAEKFLYSLTIQQLKVGSSCDPSETYTPTTSDIFAISSVRPKRVGDIIRSGWPYTLAILTWHEEEKEEEEEEQKTLVPHHIRVRTSKPIEEVEWKKGALYGVLLANLTTNIRIWLSLNLDKEKSNHCGIMKISLYNGPSVQKPDNCSCWSNYGAEESEKEKKLEADLSLFNLNESQTAAVLSCLSGRKCKHQPTAKLIWGPPGTGKTKTVSTLLWTLLAIRCKTVTCAPTNVAVVQIASRLLTILEEGHPSACSIGDVLLFGNKKRMKIEEEDLEVIFLDYRVKALACCFAPLTGWNHLLEEMKSLFEDSITQYNQYLEDVKKKAQEKTNYKEDEENRSEKRKQKPRIMKEKWEKKKPFKDKEEEGTSKEKGKMKVKWMKTKHLKDEEEEVTSKEKGKMKVKWMKPKHLKDEEEAEVTSKEKGKMNVKWMKKKHLKGGEEEEGTSEDKGPMTFKQYLQKRLVAISNGLKQYIMILRKHLSSDIITPLVNRHFAKFLSLMKSLQNWLRNSYTDDSDLEKVYKIAIKEEDGSSKKVGIGFELNSYEVQRNAFNIGKGDDDTSLSMTNICGGWSDASTRAMWKTRLECLRIVSTLQNVLKVPDVRGKRAIQDFCLASATVILCTASSPFRLRSVEHLPLVNLLIIDEAAQLKECESLIPMQIFGLQHAILIGDECQLPAMIRSEVAQKAYFGRSLFERLVSLGHEKQLLNVQYRMHPAISIFPNVKFYHKQIIDGENVKRRSYERHYLQGPMYGAYLFVNVTCGKEDFDASHSRKNMLEVVAVTVIVKNLFEAFKKSKQRLQIGVISPYKAQVTAIRKKLGTIYENHNRFSVKVKSVDGFQGGEEDIIIVSTVRSNMGGSVGFLANHQRTNVALTRARHCLWILGNGTTLLNSGSIWKEVVLDAKSRGCFFDSDMDENLVKDFGAPNIELDHKEDMLHTDSLLFLNAKWKVLFTDDFKKSFLSIQNAYIRNEIIEFMKKLSNGFRPRNKPLKYLGPKSSLKLLKQCNLQGQSLFWTVEICKDSSNSNYTQVLKFWDTLVSREEASILIKRLEFMFENYSVDYASRCRFRCLDGELEVPMCWPVGGNNLHPTTGTSDLSEENLARHLASLNLGGYPSIS